jgi:hypothetical protein
MIKRRLAPVLAVLTACAFTTALAPALRGEEPAAKPLKVGPFTFAVAAPWKESATARPMSQGTIELPGKDGAAGLTAAFYHFGPGQGGDLAGNIQRWQGMFQASPEAKTAKEEMDFGKEKATLVSITGTYTGSRFSPEKEPRTGYTLLAAVLPSAEGDVYIRLVGPEAGVAAAKEDFKKLLLTAAK